MSAMVLNWWKSCSLTQTNQFCPVQTKPEQRCCGNEHIPPRGTGYDNIVKIDCVERKPWNYQTSFTRILWTCKNIKLEVIEYYIFYYNVFNRGAKSKNWWFRNNALVFSANVIRLTYIQMWHIFKKHTTDDFLYFFRHETRKESNVRLVSGQEYDIWQAKYKLILL